MASILNPDKKVFDIITTIVGYIRDDYKLATDKKTSYLYQVFYGVKMGGYNFYDQAVAIFTRPIDATNRLDVRISFDKTRAGIPTIHITLPSEVPSIGGLGVNMGEEDPIYNDVESYYKEMHTRYFEANYSIIITSSNAVEVLCIYHLLRAVLVSILDSIDVEGLQNPSLSGGDIMSINQESLIPEGIFMRVLGLKFMYRVAVPEVNRQDIIKRIIFSNTMVGEVIVEGVEADRVILSNLATGDLLDPVYGLDGEQQTYLKNQLCLVLSGIDEGDSEETYIDSYFSIDEGGA